MALTNNEKVLRSFDQLLEGMRPWVDMRMSAQAPTGKDWMELIAAEDVAKFGTAKTYSRDDVRFLLRIVTERWKVFEKDLSRPQSALASELRETANAAHHGQKFSSDDTYRALDTIERLLMVIGAGDEADVVAKMRMEHQREVFEKQTRNRLMREAQAVKVSRRAGWYDDQAVARGHPAARRRDPWAVLRRGVCCRPVCGGPWPHRGAGVSEPG